MREWRFEDTDLGGYGGAKRKGVREPSKEENSRDLEERREATVLYVMAEAVLYQDMRYTVYQDIRYTSSLGFWCEMGRLAGSPEGDRRAFPSRGRIKGRVHPCCRSISRTYICR